jgi:hypothetical protein
MGELVHSPSVSIKKTIFSAKKALSRAATIALLALYAVGSLQVESFHRLIHGHDEAALHSPEQEKNDCHRLIFHNISEGSCHHKSHVTELKKCPLCQITVQQLHVTTHERFSFVPSNSSVTYEWLTPATFSGCRTHLRARAPPTIA